VVEVGCDGEFPMPVRRLRVVCVQRRAVHVGSAAAPGEGAMSQLAATHLRSEGRQRVHLVCPRCWLSILPRVDWLAVEHCPRCMARLRIAVRMATVPEAEHSDRNARRDVPPTARAVRGREAFSG
jgi:hypothetical protein